jgi:two-component system phosphate regulon sensor histidine kinase PhoR
MLVLSFILLSFIVFCFSFAINIILKQRQLAEMKTDFINNMTHELKTPIATISLASEALQEEDVLKEKSKRNRFLNVIKEENERLKVQVEKVLSFAKVEKNELKLNKSELDVHELIEKVISSFELIIKEKKAQLSFDYKANNKVFMGDESHMNNILRNLIDNALKYSLGSPRVKIKTRNVSNGIEISISDNGLGISAEDQAKVFEKFFRVHTGNKHDVKGFGLGLSYVQKMIQLHKGNIKVKSQLNKGSEFIIYLPYGI